MEYECIYQNKKLKIVSNVFIDCIFLEISTEIKTMIIDPRISQTI